MADVLERPAKRWTYEEYYRLDDDRRFEIIHGNLLMAPGPDVWHQDWIGDIYLLMRQFVSRKQLGRVFLSPLDVVLNEENTVQPDLVYVAKAKAGIIQGRAIFGTPDLLVEIISPFGAQRDRRMKKALYAQFGVKEYWMGDPHRRVLEIYSLTPGGYRLHSRAHQKGRLASKILPGLEFNLEDIAPA